MTHIELVTMLQGSRDLQAEPPKVPIDTVVQRFRHRIASLDALTDTLRTRADEVKRRDIEQPRRHPRRRQRASRNFRPLNGAALAATSKPTLEWAAHAANHRTNAGDRIA